MALLDPNPSSHSTAPRRRPKLLFLVTEDWYFWSHRLPLARAARAAGFEIVVATRVRAHGERVRAEGFGLRPLSWRRRGDGPFRSLRAIVEIARVYRDERPDIVHHVALKPVLFGGAARLLAFPQRRGRPRRVDAVMGLGSGFSAPGLATRFRRPLLRLALRLAARDPAGAMIVQNPDDAAALASFGIARRRISLIRGSGIDTAHFAPLPQPDDAEVAIALVARMLRDKGVLDAVGAVRRLRKQGIGVKLLLAGAPDPDNRNSLSTEALAALSREPGIAWLAAVEDVREVWRRAAIAVLPTTYGEGLPRALIEAAACARPIVATDVPGCREAVIDGVSGILVPPRDIAALAAALAALASDPVRREAMGLAGRALAERAFADDLVARETIALYRALLAAPQ